MSEFAIKLYGMHTSGNCWKPATLMQQLDIPFEWVEVDTRKGETRTPAFLAMNANGKVPLLEVRDHAEVRYLPESNAMLVYLADGTHLLPDDRWQKAKVFEWLFWEQYSHEPYIATVRWWVHYLNKQGEWKDKIADAMQRGYAALGVMEQQLAKDPFIAGRYTIADIALYAYTHVAHQGGYDLDKYPAIRNWFRRCEGQPKFKSMLSALEPARA